MASRQDVFNKYYASDIFNQNPQYVNAPAQNPKPRLNRSCLESTKEDVFNIGKERRIQRNFNNNEPRKVQPTCASVEKRKQNYDKIYGSDIFNSRKASSIERRRGRQQIPNATNRSTCFDGMKNNDEYSNDLKYYTKQHRAEKKEYDPDKYVNKVTPQERYYNQYYENSGNIISPGNNRNDEINGEKNKLDYVQKRVNLEKNEKIYNDVGADKKRIGGDAPQKEVRYVKNHPISEYQKNHRRFVDVSEFPENNCKINKQIQMESHIFSNDKNYYDKTDEEINKINERIKKEQLKQYNENVLGQPIQKPNNRDLSNNDPSLFGAVHSKWGQTNITWNSPEAEVMFGKNYTDSIYQKYGPKPTAYQRKMNQLADSQGIDTLSGYDKSHVYNYQKPEREVQVNDETSKKIEKMVDDIPNLNEGQKYGIKMKTSVLDFTDNNQWNNKAKTLNNYYKQGSNRPKNKEVTDKPTNINRNNNENEDYGYHNFVITYPLKNNQFEKFDEKDIQKLFGAKGVNVYDVHKNPFPKENYNTITLKVKGSDYNNELTSKVKSVQENLKRKNYKVNIEKGTKKNVKKNNQRADNNPSNPMNAGSTYKVMPPEYMQKKGFTNEYSGVNYDYKRPKAY